MEESKVFHDPNPLGIEDMPFEVRRMIFHEMESNTDLRALAHASPVYHDQYHLEAGYWDWLTLQLELGNLLIDAHTVARSNSRLFREEERTPEEREFFLIHYRANLASPDHFFLDIRNRSMIHYVAAFQATVIKPLVKKFFVWCKLNVPALASPRALSKGEEMRITRGLYRFQLLCNLFGCDEIGNRPPDSLTLQLNDPILGTFLVDFPPWEIKEILCIEQFASDNYRSVFELITPPPTCDSYPPLRYDEPFKSWGTVMQIDPCESFPFTCFLPLVLYEQDFSNFSEDSHQELLDGVVSLGLGHLNITFSGVLGQRTRLIKLMADNMVCLRGAWIGHATCIIAQFHLWITAYSDYHWASDMDDMLIFMGDGCEGPPWAWYSMFSGVSRYRFGEHIQPCERQWGFVMWDKHRSKQLLTPLHDFPYNTSM